MFGWRWLKAATDYLRRVGALAVRQLDGDIDAGDVAAFGDEALFERGLGERCRAHLGKRLIAERLRVLGHVADDEIVFLRLRVLEICDRVDPVGVGDLPRRRRQFLDRRQRIAREYVAVTRCDDHHDAVVLDVGVFDILEGEEFGVVVTEENAVARIEAQLGTAVAERGDYCQANDDDQQTVADDPAGVEGFEFVHRENFVRVGPRSLCPRRRITTVSTARR